MPVAIFALESLAARVSTCMVPVCVCVCVCVCVVCVCVCVCVFVLEFQVLTWGDGGLQERKRKGGQRTAVLVKSFVLCGMN